MDDRPRTYDLIPPISLLYDGPGVSDDVLRERGPAPGDNGITEAKLWGEVDASWTKWPNFMTQKDAVLRLGQIFRAQGTQGLREDINASQVIPDGHSKEVRMMALYYSVLNARETIL